MRPIALCIFLLSTALAARVEYRVQQGDTAFSIARRHGVTVERLLAQNNLTSTDLRVGQVLVLDTDASDPSAATAPASTPASAPAPSPTTYMVVAGDSLYAIARRLGLKVDDLVTLNALTSTELRVGQVLRLPAGGTTTVTVTVAAPAPSEPATRPVAAPSSPPVTSTLPASPFVTTPPTVVVPPLAPAPADTWRDRALAMLGVPYVLGGTTPQGLDCSGLVLLALSPLGVSLPRQSADMFRTGLAVNRGELREGDLVFFDTEGRGQASHVGIYLGLDVFVHANTYSGRVTVNALSEKYYADRYLGSRRVLSPTASR